MKSNKTQKNQEEKITTPKAQEKFNEIPKNQDEKPNKLINKIGLSHYLLACLVLVLIASIFGGIFGFNKSVDFTGGTQLHVSFECVDNDTLQTDKFINSASSKTKEILAKYKVDVNSFQVQGYANKSFVITFKETSKSTLEQIRLDINKEFNTFSEYLRLDDKNKAEILDKVYDLTKNTTAIESLIAKNTVIIVLSSLLFALTIVTIYTCLRFKVASGLTLALGCFLDLLLTCAFVLIARIQINSYFFIGLTAILFLSIYGSSNLVYDFYSKIKDPMLTDKTNEELITLSAKENWHKNIIVYSVSAVICLILNFTFIFPILHLSIMMLAGVLVSFFTHTLILPKFLTLTSKKRELFKPNSKQTNEVEEVGEILDDETAEVVEVKEN